MQGSHPLLSFEIRFDYDVVTARQKARTLASRFGFEQQDQTRISTAVSEIARNAFRYAGSGTLHFSIEQEDSTQFFNVVIEDKGKGILDLDSVLAGKYKSATGMGMGIVGTRRLMDRFSIQSSAGGTRVHFAKALPKGWPHVEAKDIEKALSEVQSERYQDPLSEVQRQNHELLQALNDIRKKQEELDSRRKELEHLNSELQDTNRGVVALFAELDEQADNLRRADNLKSKFLSNMSHEFRTPLNSIMGLSRILIEHTDGPLNSEQEKQVGFIKTAASQLTDLVNDLLDLAKVEAGKITIQPAYFEVEDLFAALRGMLRPLLLTESVNLIFEGDKYLPTLHTDEGKVSQILRNLISNALKFTEQGVIRVTAKLDEAFNEIVFDVSDTGLGVPEEQLSSIFDSFVQVDNRAQRHSKGTGLGLPISRRLAELLGGTLTLASELGTGSTFTARIPIEYSRPLVAELADGNEINSGSSQSVVIVEATPEDIVIYKKCLTGTGIRVNFAQDLVRARALVERIHPAVVILEVSGDGEESWKYLRELKSAPGQVPYVIIQSANTDDGRARAFGCDAFLVKPIQEDELAVEINRLLALSLKPSALVIDDEEVSRYIATQLLNDLGYTVRVAVNGEMGLGLIRDAEPDLILLDMVMPGLSGIDILQHLKSNPATSHIPVLIYTSKVLTEAENNEVTELADGIISKDVSSRTSAAEELRMKINGLGAVAKRV
ncbi:MAG TPA: ATP-binding protein [Candidatus Kapabacteria bacterium]|nr:ATP-binding protein [Candidatus Kapabacteria bacterium]